MVVRSKGYRRGTRKKLRRKASERGKIFIKRYLQEFKEGDKVIIKPDPSFQKGLPFRRFIGKVGEVVKKEGRAYKIKVNDGKKIKYLITYPVHLLKVKR